MTNMLICREEECHSNKFVVIISQVGVTPRTLPQLELLCLVCGSAQRNIEALLVSPGEIVENLEAFWSIHYRKGS